MPQSLPIISADILVKCIEAHDTAGIPFVTSEQVKQWCDESGIDWGRPHGWRFRDAEDEVFRATKPQLVKWKIDGRTNGYSGAWARILPPPGWTRDRP